MLCHDVPTGVNLELDASFARHFTDRDPAVLEWCDAHRETLQKVLFEVSPRLIVHGHHHRRMTNSFEGRYGSAVVEGLDCDGSELEWNLAYMDEGESGLRIVGFAA